MGETKISYLDAVWNPYTWNCEKVSEGCKNCYAEARTKKFGTSPFRDIPRWRPNALDDLRKIDGGQVVGINFMSDTYHEGVSLDTLKVIHSAVAARPDCLFIVTTKRSERLAAAAMRLQWPANLWVGVSIELPRHLKRLDDLRSVPTPNRWVSFEPLLAGFPPIDLTGIGWVVTGGESGEAYRPMQPEWAWSVVAQARGAGIPVFHKQGSALFPDSNRVLYGKTYEEMPEAFARARVAKAEQMRLL